MSGSSSTLNGSDRYKKEGRANATFVCLLLGAHASRVLDAGGVRNHAGARSVSHHSSSLGYEFGFHLWIRANLARTVRSARRGDFRIVDGARLLITNIR
jgi:hypothetical protein